MTLKREQIRPDVGRDKTPCNNDIAALSRINVRTASFDHSLSCVFSFLFTFFFNFIFYLFFFLLSHCDKEQVKILFENRLLKCDCVWFKK